MIMVIRKNTKSKEIEQLKSFNFHWKDGVLCVARKTYFGYSAKIKYKHLLEAIDWFSLVKEKTYLNKFPHLDSLSVHYDSGKEMLTIVCDEIKICATSYTWTKDSFCYYVAKTFLGIKTL